MLPGQRPRVSKTMAFRVSVGASIDSEREDVSCRFTRPVADGDDVLISPPNTHWLPLCTVYGEDYHLARRTRRTLAATASRTDSNG